MPVFKQLKERRIVKILVAYLAAGWIGLEATSQLTTHGIVPAATYQLALIWFVCGIPVALIVGWYHGEKGKQQATRLEVALLLVVLFVALGGTSRVVSVEMSRQARIQAAAASDMDLRRIAVMYFEDLTPAGEAQHLADGFTESLIDELVAVRELDVVSRSGVAPFRDSGLSPDSVARILNAGTIVQGTIEELGGDRLRIGIRLLDGQSGVVASRAGFEQPTSELLAARDEVARQAALLLRDWLGERVSVHRTRRETESVPAWALYQRGERSRKNATAALEHGDLHGAEESFERADRLLSQAELVDAQWLQPTVLRGRIAYQRARAAAGADPHESAVLIRRGLEHVERALAVSPNHAEALEVRGTLRYLHHLLRVEPDPALDHALFEQGQRDLERAVTLDPRLSSAHAILSHLYLNSDDVAKSVIAARRAYEEDAFVENAPAVLWRLVNGLYNLEQFGEGRRWCNEGSHRFPGDYRFVVCQLLLMTASGSEADPDRAWKLLESLDTLAPPRQAEWERIRGELLVGGVLARAGMADSARAVLQRARARVSPDIDPDRFMFSLEAHIRTLLGDNDTAIDLLTRYAAVNPNAEFQGRWWWRGLQNDPRFRELQALVGHH
jgi:TolB-like protein